MNNAVSKNTEWQTVVLIALCYLVWVVSVIWHESIGVSWIVLAIISTSLQSSLQHEALHGHPTRNRHVNEVLVSPGLGLWLPYRRYKTLHLRHHHDERIADPHDDPESWYIDAEEWSHFKRWKQVLFEFNATFAGRVTVGPFLVLAGFWRSEFALLLGGDDESSVKRARIAWLIHIVFTVPVVVLLNRAGVNLLVYCFLVVVPSISIVLVRSYIEHRAAEPVEHRTAVVEAGSFWSLMFLNNNLHAVHHRYPQEPWYRLPQIWRMEKEQTLSRNNQYYFPGGYREVFARWFWKAREPVVFPRKR